MRHSDDRHTRCAVVVAGRRRCGARSNHGCGVAARGAVAVGGATGGASYNTRAEKPQPPALDVLPNTNIKHTNANITICPAAMFAKIRIINTKGR